jgi:hypothetical protein
MATPRAERGPASTRAALITAGTASSARQRSSWPGDGQPRAGRVRAQRAALGWWWADPVAALVIAVALATEAIRVATRHRFS